MYNQVWYNSLVKPAFTPPSWVFGPVWTILYIMIFISLYLYIKSFALDKKWGYFYFGIQLVLNLIWSTLFFGLTNIFLALADIVMLDIFVILTIRKFYMVSKVSAFMLVPYIIWIIFATYLNFAFWVLNHGL